MDQSNKSLHLLMTAVVKRGWGHVEGSGSGSYLILENSPEKNCLRVGSEEEVRVGILPRGPCLPRL